jgi:hypothetical protein
MWHDINGSCLKIIMLRACLDNLCQLISANSVLGLDIDGLRCLVIRDLF